MVKWRRQGFDSASLNPPFAPFSLLRLAETLKKKKKKSASALKAEEDRIMEGAFSAVSLRDLSYSHDFKSPPYRGPISGLPVLSSRARVILPAVRPTGPQIQQVPSSTDQLVPILTPPASPDLGQE